MKILLVLFLALNSSTAVAPDAFEAASQAFESGRYEEAMRLSLPLAEAGDGDMLGNVGNMYAFGQGVEVDEKKALAYWRRAAEKHVPSALGNIASYYMLGKGGVEKSASDAVVWYLKAAEHRHVLSMISLSGMYDQGVGIPKDKIRALAWAGLAASNAPNQEVKNLARTQLQNARPGATDEDIDRAQALIFELIKVIDANVALYKKG